MFGVADGAKADASTDFDVGHRIADQDARGWSAIDDAQGPFDRIRIRLHQLGAPVLTSYYAAHKIFDAVPHQVGLAEVLDVAVAGQDHAEAGRVAAPGPSHCAVYTVPEAARRIGRSIGTTYELLRSGEIPAFRLGSRWTIPRSTFDDWLNSRATKEVD